MAMRKSSTKTFTLIEAFQCAFAGIHATFVTQRNFKIQLAFAIAAIFLGFLCSISIGEWTAIVICIGLVLGLECINTAIESIVDLVSPEYNRMAGIAKDCAAGAVLVASLASLVIAAIIFIPGLLRLFGIIS